MTQAIRPFAPQSPNPSDPANRGESGPPKDSANRQGSLEDKARFFDYREAANPVRKGLTEPIGYRQWGAFPAQLRADSVAAARYQR